MRLSTKLSGIVAVGGVAALGAGLISSGGIGAAFTDSVEATANVTVGNLNCAITDQNGNSYSGQKESVAVNLEKILSSAPSSETEKVIVSNTEDIPFYVNWSTTTAGSFFNFWGNGPVVPTQNVKINPGDSHTFNVGAKWSELNNSNLGATGTATFTATCSDSAPSYWLSQNVGGTATVGTAAIKLSVPSDGPDVYSGAAIHITNPTSLPGSQPSFISDYDSHATNPRMYIQVIDSSNSSSYITIDASGIIRIPGAASPVDWATATSYATGKTLGDVAVVLDDGNGAQTANISCVHYSGATPEFGTGC